MQIRRTRRGRLCKRRMCRCRRWCRGNHFALFDQGTQCPDRAPTFLPCLLLGLQNAPLIKNGLDENFITVNDVKTLIMPKNSLGSSIVTNAIEKGIIVLTIEENTTVLNVDADSLGLSDKVISLKNYDESIKFLRGLNEK